VSAASKTLRDSIPGYLIEFISKYQKCISEINKIRHEIKETVLCYSYIVDSSDHYLITGTGYYWDIRQNYWKTRYSVRTFGEQIVTYVCYSETLKAFDGYGDILEDVLLTTTNIKKKDYDVVKAEDIKNYHGDNDDMMQDFIDEFAEFEDEYSDIYKEISGCDLYNETFLYRKMVFKYKNGNIIVKYAPRKN
jgi:hypothetical protein